MVEALWRQRQMDLHEIKASLAYRGSSRTARAVTQRNPVSKNQKSKPINQTEQKNPKIFSVLCS